MTKRKANPRRTGRPRKELVPPDMDKLIATMASVLTQEQLADYFEVSHPTFKRRLQEQPRLLSALKKGQAQAVALVGQNLLQNAQRGNVVAQIFFLKCKGGWRERDTVNLGEFNPDDYTDQELERIVKGETPEQVLARRGRSKQPAR